MRGWLLGLMVAGCARGEGAPCRHDGQCQIELECQLGEDSDRGFCGPMCDGLWDGYACVPLGSGEEGDLCRYDHDCLGELVCVHWEDSTKGDCRTKDCASRWNGYSCPTEDSGTP